MTRAAAVTAALCALLIAGCDPGGGGNACGPTRAQVARVVDGDTIELDSGEKVRYLLVDTPESTNDTECYGPEAKAFNTSLVEGQTVDLTYDVECTDRFDRLLAYVTLDGTDVNRLMIERGFACVLHIPPNGAEVVEEYEALQSAARSAKRGLWGFCASSPC